MAQQTKKGYGNTPTYVGKTPEDLLTILAVEKAV